VSLPITWGGAVSFACPLSTQEPDPMSTDIAHAEELPDASASSLLAWILGTMLVVAGLIIAMTKISGMFLGMVVAFGGLIVAAFVVLFYIMKFIGPEGDEH
jgi:hypothetical protein